MDSGKMSYEELRKQLKYYGVSVGPITPTTYRVHVRKLNSLRNRNNRVNPESRRSSAGRFTSSTPDLNGFSSDENTESESQWHHPSVSANHGMTTDYGRSRQNNRQDGRRSFDAISDTAQPLIRPSIRTVDYSSSVITDKYDTGKSGVGASSLSMEMRNLSSQFLSSRNSSDAGTIKAESSAFDEAHRSWQLISRIIVLLVLFFVVVVIVSYCFITRSSQLPVDTRSDYLLCRGDMPLDTTATSVSKCTSGSELGLVQKMIRELLDALSARAGGYDCGYQSDARSMRQSEIIQLLDDGVLLTSDKKAVHYLPVIADMCLTNDHWGVQVYGSSKSKDFALESLIGRKSIWCRITESVRYVFTIIVVTLLFIAIGCGLYVLIRLRLSAADAERGEVLDLVEKIIDILRQNAAAASSAETTAGQPPVPPYLAIPHVRDALIPLHLRRAKQRVWDQAVRFLSEHESRVRVEHKQISGEEFAVWRWIDPAVDGAKVWQGQAFGENTAALRSRHRSSVPQNPLTTCLKIRNMFDATIETGSEWQQTVKDAVLEKCSPAAIVHLAVDPSSTEGCVYVRCSDLESAGIAFKALHGWWFDGRLVTVKYLREQRYEEHYADSRGASSAIHPSNNACMSLSQPFHSSVIENS